MEEEEFQDFPEKKAAAWHSRPWERSLGGKEETMAVLPDGQRIRFLV